MDCDGVKEFGNNGAYGIVELLDNELLAGNDNGLTDDVAVKYWALDCNDWGVKDGVFDDNDWGVLDGVFNEDVK